MKIVFQRYSRPGAWTSSAQRSRHGATLARQVSTQTGDTNNKQFDNQLICRAPVYKAQDGLQPTLTQLRAAIRF
jgi:hypothetical protein